MSLLITSTDESLNKRLQADWVDGVSPLEFQTWRDEADAHVRSITCPELQSRLKGVQDAADALAEALQHLALEVRRSKLDKAALEPVKAAIESQMVYSIVGYQASVGRLGRIV